MAREYIDLSHVHTPCSNSIGRFNMRKTFKSFTYTKAASCIKIG